MKQDKIKSTSLYDIHLNLKAKMLPYAGYMMPINYSQGIHSEYKSVRSNVGLFDVSHMGQIIISGSSALDCLQFLTVNNVSLLKDGDAQYNAICNENGGIKDDIIIYSIKKNYYMLIVNASNCKKIYNWIKIKNTFNCIINNKSNSYSLIALQGPKSRETLTKFFGEIIDLDFYKHKYVKIKNKLILISRTGYTGELGYEILCENKLVIDIWNKLINLGAIPCGLAVRDILRMEMKYCLYGNDINEETTPIEAGLDWIVKLSKGSFIGKRNIQKQKQKGAEKKLIAFKMEEKSIPRKGYKIYCDNNIIGEVTSGTYSLGLKIGIGIGYIDKSFLNTNNNKLLIEIRGKKNKGKIICPPFIKKYSLYD